MDVLDALAIACIVVRTVLAYRRTVREEALFAFGLVCAYALAMGLHPSLSTLVGDLVGPPFNGTVSAPADARLTARAYASTVGFGLGFVLLLLPARWLARLTCRVVWRERRSPGTRGLRGAREGVAAATLACLSSVAIVAVLLSAGQLLPVPAVTAAFRDAPVSRWYVSHATLLRDDLLRLQDFPSSGL